MTAQTHLNFTHNGQPAAGGTDRMACNTDSNERYYSLERTLRAPSPISSLALPHSGHLCAGAADGSLRVYDLSSFKVLKAIKGLRSEVSSIVCSKRLGTEFRDVWLACGRKVCSTWTRLLLLHSTLNPRVSRSFYSKWTLPNLFWILRTLRKLSN